MTDEIVCIEVVLSNQEHVFIPVREWQSNPPAGAYRPREFRGVPPGLLAYPAPVRDTRVHALEDTIGRDRVERQVREVQHQERVRAMHTRGEDVYCPFCGVDGGRHVSFCPGNRRAFR
jgi:hypothetical protein